MNVDRTPKPCHHRTKHQHGTYVTYTLDACRCYPCAAAQAKYGLGLRQDALYGRPRLVDADPVRDHIQALRDAGLGAQRIAHLAGVSHSAIGSTLYSIIQPDGTYAPPSKRVLRATAEAILALPVPGPGDPMLHDQTSVDATGTQRRLKALATLGWSVERIARYWGPIHIEAGGNQYDAADPKHPQHGDPNAYYRAWDVRDVIRTLHTQETKALVVPMEGRDGKEARPVGGPLRTQTTRLENGIAQPPFIAEMYGTSTARPVSDPAGTFTAGGNHHALVHRHNTGGAEMTTPVAEELRTLTTAGHQSLIQAATPTGRPKVSPKDVATAMEMVPDVLFRMFKPHEVAAGMSFPREYRWDVIDPRTGRQASDRNLTKMAGNAVTPPAARDLIAAVSAAITGEQAAVR